MKKKLIIMLCIVLIATFTMQSYAGTWRLNGSEWVNQEDFGEFLLYILTKKDGIKKELMTGIILEMMV